MSPDDRPEAPDEGDRLRPPSVPGLDAFVLIGSGGSAAVWRAWQAAFNRRVAVKVLFEHGGERAIRRFTRECLAVGAVEHPNIVLIHQAGRTEDADAPFLQMEYLPRGSIAQRLERIGPLSWKRTMEIGVKLSGALETAHRNDVLHRDIKPENVLMTAFGEPKLADFGIARVIGQSLTTTTIAAGTPEHAPPELVRLWHGPRGSHEPASHQADVYSLASTLFTLVRGRAPFTQDGDTVFTLFPRILEDPPPDLRLQGVPPQLCAVLEKGMAKRAEDRYGSALEFGLALRAAQIELKVSPTFLPFDDGGMDTGSVTMPPLIPTPTVRPAPVPPERGRGQDLASAARRSGEPGPDFRPPDDYPEPPPTQAGPIRAPGPPVMPRRRHRKFMVGILATAILILASVAAWLIVRPIPVHTVPNVEGKAEGDARRTLEALDFRVDVHREFNDNGVAPGLVARQSPVMVPLREGGTVDITVSEGPTVRPIPDLSNRTQQEAIDVLVHAGFKPGAISHRNDSRVPAGQVLDWSGKGTMAPVGASVAFVVSTPPPEPEPKGLPAGPLPPGRYTPRAFSPKVVLTALDGWEVEDANSPDLVVLKRADRPSSKVSLLRVQRVYNPSSRNLDQQQIVTAEDALNSVEDVRNLEKGVADWLSGHPRRSGGSASILDIARGGRTGKQVDAQFRSSAYRECAPPPADPCTPLFQLYGQNGQTYTFAKLASEVTRFEVFDLINGVKIVVATSALESDFGKFLDQARTLLNIEQFDFTDRISTPQVRSSVNPSNENESVSLTAEINSPCSLGRVTFTVSSVQERMSFGPVDVVDGRATLNDVKFRGRGGRARVTAEYDGPDCAKGISAPLVQAVI